MCVRDVNDRWDIGYWLLAGKLRISRLSTSSIQQAEIENEAFNPKWKERRAGAAEREEGRTCNLLLFVIFVIQMMTMMMMRGGASSDETGGEKKKISISLTGWILIPAGRHCWQVRKKSLNENSQGFIFSNAPKAAGWERVQPPTLNIYQLVRWSNWPPGSHLVSSFNTYGWKLFSRLAYLPTQSGENYIHVDINGNMWGIKSCLPLADKSRGVTNSPAGVNGVQQKRRGKKKSDQ